MSDSTFGADASGSENDDRESQAPTSSDDEEKLDVSGLPESENAPHLDPEIAAKAKGMP